MKRATPNFLKSILDFEIIQRPLKTIPKCHTQLGHTQSDHPSLSKTSTDIVVYLMTWVQYIRTYVDAYHIGRYLQGDTGNCTNFPYYRYFLTVKLIF